MSGDVIKSFLVGLGFGVDESSLAKFNKAIVTASLKVAALSVTVQAAATGIFYGISKISEGFEQMGYEMRLVAPAMNKFLVLREAMLHAYKMAGVDLTKVVKQSILFNLSLQKTKYALEAVYKSVGARFLPLLTKQMDIFRLKIFQNMPKIQNALEKFINFLFKVFEGTIQLGSRVWEILQGVWAFFDKLDTATDGWSTKILAAIAIWKLLNLEFLATPLGMLLLGLLAILALYDDFKVWQAGGKSFFDWSSAVPIINAVSDALTKMKTIIHDVGVINAIKKTFTDLKEVLNDIIMVVFDVVGAFVDLFNMDWGAFKESMTWIWEDLLKMIKKVIDSIMDFIGIGAAVKNWATPLFGGANAGAATSHALQPTALLPTSNQTHQKVSQETNITVQGSADANSVGKAVAGEQTKVNFDMVRNMKGAMR